MISFYLPRPLTTFFLFWTLIAELVIDSISVLARTRPRLAGEDWPHGREYCWRYNHALNAHMKILYLDLYRVSLSLRHICEANGTFYTIALCSCTQIAASHDEITDEPYYKYTCKR